MNKIIYIFLLLISSLYSFAGEIDTVTITVTFGRCHFYSVQSNEAFDWSGNLNVENGQILSINKLTYSKWNDIMFGPSQEYSRKLEKPEWKSELVPHSGEGLEGIRFTITGEKASLVKINTKAINIEFTLDELIEKEFMEYHAGGKYSGHPVKIFLGHDSRIRVTQKSYLSFLDNKQKFGWLVMPEDLSGYKQIFNTKYCCRIDPGEVSTAGFPVKNFRKEKKENIDIRLQMLAGKRDSLGNLAVTDSWVDFEVEIGKEVRKIKHYFTNFRGVQKLKDIYIQVPLKELKENDNIIKIRNLDDKIFLFVFRIYINESFPDHKANLLKLPPLPENPGMIVGYDANVITPQNGEMDSLISLEHNQKIGNYILFRPEVPHFPEKSDYERWTDKLKKYNLKAALVGKSGSFEDSIFRVKLKDNYLGIHQHECSNLIYGWGEPDPIEKRKGRTLPECKEYYFKRMKNIKVLGQALPVVHMDYEAGVNFVFSEPPTGHATILLSSSRGAAKAFDKKIWGMHVANHLPLNPADKGMERRNFIMINQGWLYGARVIYDEESALFSIHDAPHSFADSLPYNRRKQLQELFHFGSNVILGEEVVKIGFLQGLYDCVVGGLQANPYCVRTKVWGTIGPEKESWTFNTPERGWELLNDYMPGVWLYPVLQDPKKIRLVFGSSPHGQVDLVPIEGRLNNLKKYDLLIMPGWNTMTDEIYDNLVKYVKNGGHLVLSATQCTNHITRDFLTEKKDFNFYRNGDLSRLAGIKVGKVNGKINKVKWFDGKICDVPDLPTLEVKMAGAKVLAGDENGKPVLVENKVGKGKVWMLTVGEFWGSSALDTLRRQINTRLINMHPQEVSILGETEDIDYHHYKNIDGSCRVVLLNTDWTKEGNIKNTIFNYGRFSFPVEVKEGRLTNVLIKNDIAMVFKTPSTVINKIDVSKNKVNFTIGSVDNTSIEIISLKDIRTISIGGKEIPVLNGKSEKLSLTFGEKWCEKNIIVTF